MNEAVEAPAATATEAGTVSAAGVEDSVTDVAAAAALESVTVHVVLALAARDGAVHCRVETATVPIKEMFVETDALFSDAVTVAV